MDRNRDKDLDRFFRNKMNDRKFDYKDEYWREMQTLLSNKKVKRTFWQRNAYRFANVFLFIGLISISAWLMLPYLGLNQVNEERLNLNKEEKTKTKDKSNPKTSLENPQASVLDNTAVPKADIQSAIIDITEQNNTFKADVTIPQPVEIIKNTSFANIFDASQTESINQNNITTTNNTTSNSDLFVVLTEENKAKNSTKANQNNNKELTAESLIANQSLESNYLQKLIFKEVKNSAFASINIIAPNCDGCPQLPKFRQFKLGITAGAVASKVWNGAASTMVDLTYNPTFGVSLVYYNSPIASWGLTTGLQYWSRSLANTMQEYETTTYSFGSTTSIHQINIQELHYASLPLNVVYNVGKHQLIGGVNLSYLINTQSQTAGDSTIYSANQVELVDIPSKKQWGVIAPFNRLDIGMTLGYDYQINDAWRVGGQINYGFVDITKDDYFNANTFDNNLQIKLSLTHDIFNYKF